MMYFQNYRLQKALLLKCLRRSEWEHLSTVNMLKGPKQSWNMQGSSFVIFFDHSEKASVRKIPSYLRPWDCLITYWLPMTSILSR